MLCAQNCRNEKIKCETAQNSFLIDRSPHKGKSKHPRQPLALHCRVTGESCKHYCEQGQGTLDSGEKTQDDKRAYVIVVWKTCRYCKNKRKEIQLQTSRISSPSIPPAKRTGLGTHHKNVSGLASLCLNSFMTYTPHPLCKLK